jgi:hypothetical protein
MRRRRALWRSSGLAKKGYWVDVYLLIYCIGAGGFFFFSPYAQVFAAVLSYREQIFDATMILA